MFLLIFNFRKKSNFCLFSEWSLLYSKWCLHSTGLQVPWWNARWNSDTFHSCSQSHSLQLLRRYHGSGCQVCKHEICQNFIFQSFTYKIIICCWKCLCFLFVNSTWYSQQKISWNSIVLYIKKAVWIFSLLNKRQIFFLVRIKK